MAAAVLQVKGRGKEAGEEAEPQLLKSQLAMQLASGLPLDKFQASVFTLSLHTLSVQQRYDAFCEKAIIWAFMR